MDGTEEDELVGTVMEPLGTDEVVKLTVGEEKIDYKLPPIIQQKDVVVNNLTGAEPLNVVEGAWVGMIAVPTEVVVTVDVRAGLVEVAVELVVATCANSACTAKDWVVVIAGSPDVVVVVRDCVFSTLDELIMAVVEWVVIAVPVGVEVVKRGKVVAVDEVPPVDFMDVKGWVVVIVAASSVLVLVLLLTVVSERNTMLPVVVGD